MYTGSGIKRSGDFLQDAQGHQSSITSPENIPGERMPPWHAEVLESDMDQTQTNLIGC